MHIWTHIIPSPTTLLGFGFSINYATCSVCETPGSQHYLISWILHHDNAPDHAAFSVAQFLTSKGITVMSQPPYSPDLAPCDFFLFQKAKSAMKGRHFESTEDIQRSVTQALNDIPQAAFQECYKQWQHCWKTCV